MLPAENFTQSAKHLILGQCSRRVPYHIPHKQITRAIWASVQSGQSLCCLDNSALLSTANRKSK